MTRPGQAVRAYVDENGGSAHGVATGTTTHRFRLIPESGAIVLGVACSGGGMLRLDSGGSLLTAAACSTTSTSTITAGLSEMRSTSVTVTLLPVHGQRYWLAYS